MSRLVTRRELLQLSAASVAASLSGRLYAAPIAGPRFLLVFLRGGYDAANMLIPYSSNFYYEARPTIAIARPDSTDTSGALALDADWALAPSLRDTLGALYLQRQAAFVPFTGTDDLSRSHFETQDSIELGQPLGSLRDYRSGFLARLAGTLSSTGASLPAIAFTDALPLTLRGPAEVPNLSLRNADKPFDARQERVLVDMYTGRPLQRAVESGLALRAQVASMADEMRVAGRNAVNTNGFAAQAARIASLMRDRYRIGFVDVAGWDTHVNEGASQGALATNLGALGSGLASFAQSMGSEWRNTVVVVLSEFGRTFRENGDRGTDHGHGTVYWILGGAINGGRIAGAQQRIARETLFQDRDYPVLNDYRAVLGGLFRSLWQLPQARCEQVFPQSRALDLELV